MSDAERPAYRVVLASSRVERELDSLSHSDYRRVISELRSLERDPKPDASVRIRGDIYRLRLGRFRIIYLIDDRERRVVVGAIRRRSETTYRDVRRLF